MASSVLIASCGREVKEKESLWEEMLNKILVVKEENHDERRKNHGRKY